ncbi:LytTR family DNA-binding domain-containing protein [Chryseobacterium sp. NKUCC03_KSP]|uniref:LytR/AlgR family response regulator transcription factor n=1 Tax=Chryseobacterium sp. NKUCC03_KSP TaxID=2842125 RepID=UPI001C5BC25D|nr:response regulator transcription factor [Chryseobacterium sp. NKUCC03_KSP]MBW3524827.1 response regulator transcription factor [Chryseobacterium sp. NKUCC03_KSP]
MKKRILIVEDEMIIAAYLQIILEDLGYCVVGIMSNLPEIISILKLYSIDMVLLDINLGENKCDGIEIGELLNQTGTPFVYTTSYSDKETLSKAIETNPLGYLIKPINSSTVYSQLELIFKKIKQHTIQIDDAGKTYIINCNDIFYIKAEGNYTTIFKRDRNIVLRKSLKNIKLILPDFFIQIHKSYIVNGESIKMFKNNEISLKSKITLPSSRFYRKAIVNYLNLKKYDSIK